MNLRSFVTLACFGVTAVQAQMVSITDGTTPPAVQAGAPLGAYKLSGFETVNLYSGHLNFSLPLYNVTGRGEAGYQIQLPVERNWRIENSPNNGVDIFIPLTDLVPTDPWWGSNYQVYRYTPGRVVARAIIDASQTPMSCYWNGLLYQISQGQTLTRLTYTEANGTEHELVDTSTFGQPAAPLSSCSQVQSNPQGATFGFDRGKVFTSHDGSAMTFVSDSDIYDLNYYQKRFNYPVTGWLQLPNGTKIHFSSANGFADQIVDRNGNASQISYTANGFNVTDALGRLTAVTYADFASTFADTITYYGYQATPRVVTINWAVLGTGTTLPPGQTSSTLGALFPMTNAAYTDGGRFAPYVLASVVLPDSSSYTFQYNIYAELTHVGLPTGGAIEYAYPLTADCSGPDALYCGAFEVSVPGTPADSANVMTLFRRVKSRTVKSNGTAVDNQTFFIPTYTNYSGTSVQVDVEDASGTLLTRTIHSYSGDASHPSPYPLGIDLIPYPTWSEGEELSTSYYKVEDSQVEKTVTNTWAQPACSMLPPCWSALPGNSTAYIADDPAIYQVTTTLSETTPALTSAEVRLYDQYNNVTERYEFDYGSAPAATSTYPVASASNPCASYMGFIRCTHDDFLTSGYDQPNLALPGPSSSNHIRDLRTTTRVYGPGPTKSAETDYFYDETSPSLQTTPGIIDVEGAGYYGHLSAYSTSFVAGRGNLSRTRKFGATSSSYDLTAAFDVAGNIVQAVDGKAQATTITYRNPDYAFPTQVCKGVYCFTQASDYQGVSGGYGGTGQLTSRTDLNNVATTFEYNDPLDRVTKAVRASGVAGAERQSLFIYTNSNTVITTKTDNLAYQDAGLISKEILDGMGREIESRAYEDGNESGTNYISVDKIYDAAGRVYQVSNPYRQSDTVVYTTTAYDSFNRVLNESGPDGSSTANSYANNVTTVTDPAGKKRSTTSDALGRIAQVNEDPAGANFATVYTYNALDSLMIVHQPGGLVDRTFGYDWLQRLTSAFNPESGTVNYTSYDNNGNLLSKTDARSVQTSMSYDVLDHLLTKTYTPASYGSPVTYTYNNDIAIAGHTEMNYPTGRLVQVSNGNSTTVYRYDAAGRTQSSWQRTASQDYVFGYQYVPAGLTSMTYPSGRQVTYALDGAGRVSEVDNGTATDHYASGVQYAAHGAVQQLTLGNGIQESVAFNSRMQPKSLTAGALLGLTWSHCADGNGADACTGNNGNLLGQTIAVGGKTFTQSYGYDAFNRILNSSESNGGLGWTQSYATDNYGNVAVSGPVNGGSWLWGAGSFDAATNRISNWGYDASGNITGPGVGTAFATIGYDGENRQTSYQATGETAQYSYDGDGRRVQGLVNGAAVVYVYNAMGDLAAEYGANNGTSGGRQYVTADYLGSTRLMTDAGGSVVERRDYAPYGEEIEPAGCSQPVGPQRSPRCDVTGYSADAGMRVKFTGKERDAESGFDFFETRYFSAAQGRFSSPDAYGVDQHPEDPQSWNLYTYARNNPLKIIDPSGEYVCAANVSAEQCDNFQASLDRAQAAANNLKEKYGEDSTQYKDAQRAIDAYGTENIDNGVLVKIGDPGSGRGGKTEAAGLRGAPTDDNLQGQNIVVTLRASDFGEAASGLAAVHEGSHVADAADWVKSGFADAMNPTSYQTEFRAYQTTVDVAGGMARPEIGFQGILQYWIGANWDPNLRTSQINWLLRNEYRVDPNSKLKAWSKNTRLVR